MKILIVADEISKAYYDYFEKDRLKDIDLILSAGDLPAEYLEFLVTMGRAPVLYVRGNHDTKYDRKPPEGCICIEDQIYEFQGLRILGLGGSMRYTPNVSCQYTEAEMEKRVRRLRFSLWRRKGFDILLTHAAAAGIGDGMDIPHRGFETFVRLMDRYCPRYMIHGHMHFSYNYRSRRLTQYGPTTIINGYESYVLEID